MERTFIDCRRIPIAHVLEQYGVHLRAAGRNALSGPCPLPTHTSVRSKDSFSVETNLGLWACHSESCSKARGGRKGGNVLSFVAAMEGCSIQNALAILSRSLAPRVRTNPQPINEAEAKPVVNPPLPFRLKGLRYSHPYLQERGISPETAESFGVGYYPGRGSMRDRVVISIHNTKGDVVAYAGRSVESRVPKYRFPRGFRKNAEVFNLHRVATDHVLVVEGFFDCMRIWQAGHPSTVALMGCSLSEQQEAMLVSRFKRVTLLLDGDEAGRNASERIAGRLVRSVYTRILMLPWQSQPDMLTVDDIRAILAAPER